jgi:hypothetical protein
VGLSEKRFVQRAVCRAIDHGFGNKARLKHPGKDAKHKEPKEDDREWLVDGVRFILEVPFSVQVAMDKKAAKVQCGSSTLKPLRSSTLTARTFNKDGQIGKGEGPVCEKAESPVTAEKVPVEGPVSEVTKPTIDAGFNAVSDSSKVLDLVPPYLGDSHGGTNTKSLPVVSPSSFAFGSFGLVSSSKRPATTTSANEVLRHYVNCHNEKVGKVPEQLRPEQFQEAANLMTARRLDCATVIANFFGQDSREDFSAKVFYEFVSAIGASAVC